MPLEHTLLNELLRYTEIDGQVVRPYLRPGLQATVIAEQCEAIGITPPADLIQLYTWADGIEGDDTVFFFTDHAFLPLEAAIAEYRECVRWSAEWEFDFQPWFPFASYQGSNLMVYSGATPFHGFAHPILRMFEGLALVYIDLATMVQTLITWYQTQTYHQQYPTNGPKMDIWANLNPNLPIEV